MTPATIGGGGSHDDANASLRLCGWCSASLEGKRVNAKFCAPSCRVNFSRAGRRPRLTDTQRSKCQDCGTRDWKCSRHSTKPARGRTDTTYPHPLWNVGRMSFDWQPKRRKTSGKEWVDGYYRNPEGAGALYVQGTAAPIWADGIEEPRDGRAAHETAETFRVQRARFERKKRADDVRRGMGDRL